MKRVLVSLILNLYFVTLTVAGVETDLQKDNLIGPAQTVRTETAQFSNQSGQWVEGPLEPSASVIYDTRGNRTEVIGNVFVGKTLHIHDAQGDLTETLDYSPDGALSEKMVYAYDNKKNLRKTVSYSPDGVSLRTTLYTYSASGQLIEQISCDDIGCFDRKACTYDIQGNLIEESFYSPDGSGIKLRLVHTYNEQGRRTQTESYDPHDAGLGIEKTVETYDANGNSLELTTYYTEKVGDEEGKPIPPPNKWIYTYEWDAHGNWIKQTRILCTSETGSPVCEPSMVTYRTITYYPETGGK